MTLKHKLQDTKKQRKTRLSSEIILNSELGAFVM